MQCLQHRGRRGRAAAMMLLICSLCTLSSGVLRAQEYPSRAIRFVTSSAGGAGDFLSRVIAQAISPPLGQPVVVDRRGSGILGTVAQARPDGYTLLVASEMKRMSKVIAAAGIRLPSAYEAR